MAGRVYTVTFSAVAVSVQQDLFELSPADDKPLRLLGIFVGQTSDSQDAQDEQVQWQVIRGFTSSGSVGTAATPRAVNRSDVAAGFAAEVNNTTLASTGTTHTLHVDAFNVRAGLAHWWTPETCPEVSQADTTIVVRLAAPIDVLTMSGTLYVEELG